MPTMFSSALLALASTNAAVDTPPAQFRDLLVACVQSGGQAGYRTNSPGNSGELNLGLLATPGSSKTITVNVWTDARGLIPARLQLLQAGGTVQNHSISGNSSITVQAPVANLFLSIGDWNIAWCSRID